MAIQTVDVEAINLRRKAALLNNGAVVPITLLLDGDGDDTDDLEEAAAFTAGPHGEMWFSGLIADFQDPRTIN